MDDPMNLKELQAKAEAMTETTRQGPNVHPFRPPAPQPEMTFEQKVDDLFSRLIFDNGDRPLLAPRWRVRDTVEMGGVIFIGGQSGAGKSFVVFELARCLMLGTAFFGRKIDHRCAVVLFAPEGQATIDARMAAMKRHYRIDEDLPFAHLGECPDLTKAENRVLVAAMLRRANEVFKQTFNLEIGVVFVDTVAASLDMEDQNNNSEVTRHVKGLKQLAAAVGPEVSFIGSHHYGKTVENGLTGGHAWLANADQVLSVLATKDPVTGEVDGLRSLSLAKNRNGQEGPIGPFDLTYLGLGYREDGDEWGSMVLVPRLDQLAAVAKPKGVQPQKNHTVFRDAVFEALIEHGRDIRVAGGQGPVVRAVPLSPYVRELFFSKYPTGDDDPSKTPQENQKTKNETRKKAYARVFQKLDTTFATEEINDVEWIWNVKKAYQGTAGT